MSQILCQAHDRLRVYCFQVSQSSGLAKEHLGVELTCSNARPKSEDEKWGLGVPNGEENAGRVDKNIQHNTMSCPRS